MLATMDAVQTLSLTDDECWNAVLQRDRRYDGRFVTAVRSTKIFCRPSCPARTPRREGVWFYADPAAALSAGFRPCKRCTPQTQAADIEVVERLCRAIQAHPDHALKLSELGDVANLSSTHVQRLFKCVTGISPREYAEMCRLDAFKAALRTSGSVVEAIYEAGYGSSSSVYERTVRQLGMTPLAFRGGGDGMDIVYTITDCYLGRLLVAATERGVCAISIGETDDFLEAMLNTDYPNATIQRGDSALGGWVQGVIAALEGSEPSREVPLDIQATVFQRRVWSALQAIPYGETRTYSEVAATLGDVKLTRAVAQACARNPVPILIPCHRVMRKSGDLGGYRWGLNLKQQLISHEKHKA